MTRLSASLGLAALAALGLAARPATAQVVTQFNSPILTTTSPSGAETLVFSGLITNFGTTSVQLEGARVDSIADAAGDQIGLGLDQDLFGKLTSSFTFAPGTMTPVSFIDAFLSPGQAPGLYNMNAGGGGLPTLNLQFSDGEQTNTNFAVDVTPAATPEPSACVGLSIGLLGLGALGMKARRRTAA